MVAGNLAKLREALPITDAIAKLGMLS